jgi:DNA-binding transcriptional regulator YiaG
MGYALHALSTVADLETRTRFRQQLPPPAVRRTLRHAAGASIGEVATVVGVSRQAVSMWELGQRSPSVENLGRYVTVLHALRRAVLDGGDMIDTLPVAAAADSLAGTPAPASSGSTAVGSDEPLTGRRSPARSAGAREPGSGDGDSAD